MRAVLFWVIIYFVAMALLLTNEIVHKKRSFAEVRKDYKRVLLRNTIIFVVLFATAWACWYGLHVLGLKVL